MPGARDGLSNRGTDFAGDSGWFEQSEHHRWPAGAPPLQKGTSEKRAQEFKTSAYLGRWISDLSGRRRQEEEEEEVLQPCSASEEERWSCGRGRYEGSSPQHGTQRPERSLDFGLWNVEEAFSSSPPVFENRID
ncbi:hypothetical protein ACLOJK_034821 [Asimina triloba]